MGWHLFEIPMSNICYSTCVTLVEGHHQQHPSSKFSTKRKSEAILIVFSYWFKK